MPDSAAVGVLPPSKKTRLFKSADGAQNSEMKLYLLLTLLGVGGYLWSDQNLISPADGVGYWLGILGGLLMLTLLLYPVRKRVRFLSFMGSTSAWFQVHMLFGLIGPLLILYHCNFNLGSLNSQVALYSTLLVAGSGIIGRHFYATIHRGLYGRKTSLDELLGDLRKSMEQNSGLATFTPHLVGKLNAMSEEMRGCEFSNSLGISRSLKWTFTHRFKQVSLYLIARRELQMAAAKSPAVAKNYKRLLQASSRYISDFTKLVGRVARFSFYERLFALWHVLHLPVFFLLVISASFHVLAVHMY